MKREIRFKAKSKETGEWVLGMPIYKPFEDKCFMFPPQGICGSTGVEVDPDTVSQYTGVKDRNGVEIYEGDIILFHFKHHIFPGSFDERHHIYWKESDMMWAYDNLTNPNTSIDSFAETLSVVEQKGSKCWIEVIGNEYDNPELLEELDV